MNRLNFFFIITRGFLFSVTTCDLDYKIIKFRAIFQININLIVVIQRIYKYIMLNTDIAFKKYS